jgi:periplasmic divalent cation tolerance protein
MERVVLVYTTYPSLVEAEKAGRSVVAQRLAACVNILPGMVSHYWWEGKVERGEEVVMIIKTRASFADRVRKAIKAEHPYKTPAIVVIPVESVEDTYLRWIMAETDRAALVNTPG